MKKIKSFTLVEMMIVVSIIAILASVVVISISSAQKRARDTQRKADLTAIVGGMMIYHTENKTWKLDCTGSTACGLAASLGNGYYAVKSPPTSGYGTKSISEYLQNIEKDVNRAFRDPLCADQTIINPKCSGDADFGMDSHNDYMFYSDATHLSVFAHLENPSDKDKESTWTSRGGGFNADGTCTAEAVTPCQYGMNYAINVSD